MELNRAIYERLQKAARDEEIVTYSQIAPLAELNMSLDKDRAELGGILGDISTYEYNNGRPLLSVVALLAETYQPSGGFFRLAEKLGVYSKGQDRDEFYINEIKKARKYWKENYSEAEDPAEISVESYVASLGSEEVLKKSSVDLLFALFNAPNSKATSTELAELMGYGSYPPINALIGNLGYRVAKFLNLESASEKKGWEYILDGEQADHGFIWWLKPNLVDALKETKILHDFQNALYPEVVGDDGLFEGAKKTVQVNSYERSNKARNQCIAYHGIECVICGINFYDAYGEIGKGFIHVHHLKEISLVGAEYRVDPVKDLRPVCPNCHAMLHRRKPAYSIEEITAMLNSK